MLLGQRMGFVGGRSKTIKVLIMDDEPVVANSLAQILKLFGYDSVAVYNPQQALEHIASNPCDVLISDVVVPGHMSGIDLAVEFSKLLPLCKVILISGNHSTAELLRDSEEHGHYFEILAKPVHPNEILDRVKTLTA